MSKPLSRKEWVKTPYASSTVANPDGAIDDLLTKYRVSKIAKVVGAGPSGRPAFEVRFELNGRVYCLAREALNAEADPAQLLRQVKRVIFFHLKALLEHTIFFPTEEVLFPYLILKGTGKTVFQAAEPMLSELGPDRLRALMLPPAGG